VSSDSDSTNPPGGRAVQTTPQKTRQGRLADRLSRGEAAARAGQRGEARRLFREALVLDAANEDAWLWLGFLASSPRQRLDYLQQALSYHPYSKRVRQAIAWAQERQGRPEHAAAASQAAGPQVEQPGRQASRHATTRLSPEQHTVASPAAPTEAPEAQRSRRWSTPVAVGLIMITLAVVAVIVANSVRRPAPSAQLQPGLTLAALPDDMATLRALASEAVSSQDWGRTIPLLERMHQLSPDDDGVRQQLAVAHLRCGLRLADEGQLDQAIAHYDAAIRFYANDVDLQTARRLAIGYRDGRQAVEQARWGEAVTLLQPVCQVAPDFRDVADLLFTAYVQQAAGFESAGRLEAARQAYASAVDLKPDASEARARLVQITATLTPPTPTPTPRPRKRIVVDVPEQRLRAYENDSLVFDWLCSTGEPARATRYGSFQVLDKIPAAWSSVWGLTMPHWLGIYWAGGSENGIHALPIDRNGQTLWAGFLGHRVSFGCIILDTPNAIQLYQWAEIGTPVTVAP